MTVETYWLVVPFCGIGLSLLGWLALWITRQPGRAAKPLIGPGE
jgi:hypothetical protein